ncbi:glutamine amidotransferase subunit [Collariella sp. IMI 366227]|nr:glutamine amidotransferase subunit [Collariella sp. IMI 366227]
MSAPPPKAPLSEDNCHPFCHGSLMWMHNGGLGGWKQIKRKLGERLADKWYLGVGGGTDSEWAFALFLDTLERMGHDPSSQPQDGFGPTVLRKAMLKTIAQINELIDNISESVIHAENVDTRSLLNFAVSDGHSVICTRYIGSSTDEAASLYYSSGTLWETRAPAPDNPDYQMERSDKPADVVLVASEPLTFERANWVNVPTNSILTIHNQTVMVHPIMDQYYDRDPHHRRSTAFVRNKGLSANEKGTTGAGTPLNLPAISRSRTPDGLSTASTLPRSRTPLSRAENVPPDSPATTLQASPMDVRALTAPPVIRSASQQPPAQGNIKKKRASLSAVDVTHGGVGAALVGYFDSSPVTPEPVRTEFGNPHKIARLFPELALPEGY